MLTDLQLLSRYHEHGDAMAFRDLMQAHAGMVFSTARRITQDESLAEDVAQETFFQLARQSQRVTQSVAAWLHRVAWRKACNVVRDSQVRRQYEQEAASTLVGGAAEEEATWAEIEPILDTIIDELPDDLRTPLVMHFLQGRSQREIATELNLSQSTVSRTVDSALTELRQRLRSRKLICGVGLATLLTANATSAAPAALITSLTKLSMSGIGASATAVAGAAASTPWLVKAAVATLITTAGVVALQFLPQETSNQVDSEQTPIGQVGEIQPPLRVSALPFALSSTAPAASGPASPPPATGTRLTTFGKPTPVHELVHSFPLPPRHPYGHLVKDAQGWLWGTTGMGGRYGRGTLFRMRPDGSDWEEKVSFNGTQGRPLGASPAGGVAMDQRGILWGTTISGGKGDGGTLYRYDPERDDFQTVAELEGLHSSPQSRPTLAPDGQVWGTTSSAIYRYNPATRQLASVLRFTGMRGNHPGARCQAELVEDGHGWFWGTTSEGGERGLGTVFKIEIATARMQTVVQFTGTEGAAKGRAPWCGLRLRDDGFLWGSTRMGGSADHGTIFKVHADTGTFTSVAEFNQIRDRKTGMNPETILCPDGTGYLWGTASYGGTGPGTAGSGTVYRVNEATGELSTILSFTRLDEAAPGGPSRGHLLQDQAGSLIGLSGFGGLADSGVIYRVDVANGNYRVVKYLGDLARTTEGVEPHGRLVEGQDGWLWGTTFYHGTHHCGTIYKLDPVTQKLVSVIDFTGRDGLNRGRSPDAGLVSDGRGYLWGTTRFGGKANRGTVFKFHEATGVLTTIADFGRDPGLMSGGPMAELVQDAQGGLWGTSYTSVFKIDPHTHQVKTVATFGGDRAEPYGEMLGTLGLDAQGQIWGCALTGRLGKKASLFKIDPTLEQFQTVTSYADANAGWSGWHPSAHMHRDPTGMLYFTGVLERGGPRAKGTLNRLNPATGQVEILSSPRDGGFQIDTPVSDDHGRLWGAMIDFKNSSLYSYDTSTRELTKFMDFTGAGAQTGTGSQAMFGRLMKNSDGNLYSVTRYGGPGNGGTIYRLRFGPTPMTQEAVLLADGRAELHGVLRPNGRDTEASFEWGTDPKLADARSLPAGIVRASDGAKPVVAILEGLKPGTSYYFRLVGQNPDNSVPQRGAVLRFSLPSPAGDAAVLAAADRATPKAGSSNTSLASRQHALKVVLIPGAGAGIVSGALQGEAYRIGSRYSLTARADNDYLFTHWSGPGITGSMAENPQLVFTFTEELARAPVITATFVKNPFQQERIGRFRSLVRTAEGLTPSVENTGLIDLQITRLGTFTGRLRYDGDDCAFTGMVDTGGSARFRTDRAFIWTFSRDDKPPVALCFQMDLSTTTQPEIHGFIGVIREKETVWQSVFNAERSLTGDLPETLGTAPAGGYEVTLTSDRFTTPGSGQLRLMPANSVHLVGRLPDGTSVTGQAPLSQSLQPSFFEPLYPGQRGSFGARVSLPDLLSPSPTPQDDTWWFTPGEAAQSLVIQRTVPGP